MILLRLRGRLGNHLFQIFAIISAAIETGQSFGFYQENNNPDEGTWWDSMFSQLTSQHVFPETMIHDHTYKEKGSSDFSPLSEVVRKWRNKVGFVDGYLVHLKYVEKYLHDIVEMLQLKQLQAHVFEKVFPLIPSLIWSNTVSLHFRIGDYLTTPGVKVLSPQYYEEALAALVRKVPNFDVIYFCEPADVPTVQPVIRMLESKFPGVTFYKVPDGLKDWEEMLFMSCCQHHIIANSTFSFWAALLGVTHDTDSKWVAYPKEWGKTIMGDAIPPNWIPIHVI